MLAIGTFQSIAFAQAVGSGVAQAQSTAISPTGCATSAQAPADNAVSVGCGSFAGASQANGKFPADVYSNIAIGANAQAPDGQVGAGGSNIAIGGSALATSTTGTGGDQIAIGNRAHATADDAVALGTQTDANARNAIVIGGNFSLADANSANAVVLGVGAQATNAPDSVVVGTAAVSTAARTIVIGGGNAVAQAADGIALGYQSNVSTANSVALGNNAIANLAAVATPNVQINGVTYAYAGAAPVGVVSLGAPGAERQVTNVAAGRVNATSTDAVNGSQLFATNSAVSAVGDALGGLSTTVANLNNSVIGIVTGAGLKYFHANSTNADALSSGAESTAMGPQAVASGASSLAAGDQSLASGTSSVAVGQAARATGQRAVAFGLNSSSSGTDTIAIGTNAITTAASAGGVALGAGANADRAGMGGQREAVSNVVVSSTQGAVSVGSLGNERQITNVAGGTEATDAVNLRQLQAVTANGVKYQTNADGSTNYSSVVLGNGQAPNGTTVSNVAPGAAGTDAVNVNQLNAGVASANLYTERRVGELQGNVDKVAKDASAGTAGAMAMANLAQATIPGKGMVAAGVATYDGASALAVGVSKLSENGAWILKFSGSANSRGKIGVAASAGYHW